MLRIRQRRPGLGRCSSLARAYRLEDLRNQRRVLDTGDDLQCSAAIGTGLDVNGEYQLQTLHLRHGLRMSRAAMGCSCYTL
jgi:hypothetical protein